MGSLGVPSPAPFTGVTLNSNWSHGLGLGTVKLNSGTYTTALIGGVLPLVTLWNSTLYQMSGSFPVMSREKGGVQVSLIISFRGRDTKSFTAGRSPA